MTDPEAIDVSAWPRRQWFEHYLHRVPCTYSMTTEIDVTEFAAALQDSKYGTYLTQVWAIATVVNMHPEFRMTLIDEATPAIWDTSYPRFTVFNPDQKTFAALWVAYDEDFHKFHDTAKQLIDRHRRATSMFPQADQPPNTFDVSSLPWTSFTGFNLNIADGWRHLAPVFTLGKYVRRDGRTCLPLVVQIHHAAADGFHTASLIEDLRELVAEPAWLTGR